MSGCFESKKLSVAQRNFILSSLQLIEKTPEINKTVYKYGKKPIYKKLELLSVFSEKDGVLHIPYNYILTNIGIHPNNERKHGKMIHEFIGELRDYQIDVCVEALKTLHDKQTTILNLYASFGKTVIGTYLASKLGYKTVILLATDLIKSWIGTVKRFLPESKVWLVAKGKPPPEDTDIYVCMERRIKYIPPDQLKQVGTLVIDECHQFGTQNRVESLLEFTPRYTIALSATFEKKNGFHRVIELICGTDKIVRKREGNFKVYRYATNIKTPIVTTNGTPDWSSYRETTSLNSIRNGMILDICETLLKVEKKVLILTWLNDNHVKVLLDMLTKKFSSVDYLAGNKKSYKECRILVGSIQKIGTGFDEKDRCDNFDGDRRDTLIVAGTVKSVELLEQMVGRVFRAENPTVIHMVDDDGISRSHWLGKGGEPGCRQWYLDNGGEITNVSKLTEKTFK